MEIKIIVTGTNEEERAALKESGYFKEKDSGFMSHIHIKPGSRGSARVVVRCTEIMSNAEGSYAAAIIDLKDYFAFSLWGRDELIDFCESNNVSRQKTFS